MIVTPLLAYLKGKEERGVRIVGDEAAGLGRVPTISFVVVGPKRVSSREIVRVFDEAGNVRPSLSSSSAAADPSNITSPSSLTDQFTRVDRHPLRTLLRVDPRRVPDPQDRTRRLRRPHFSCALQHPARGGKDYRVAGEGFGLRRCIVVP